VHRQEELDQIAIFRWAAYQEHVYPELKLLYHCPNGGKRSKAEAGRLKAAGVKAGVPDIFLPVPRGGYHGLYVELKVGKNTPTKAQSEWITELSKQGYKTSVCWGAEAAIAEIRGYLNAGRTVDE